MAELKLSGNHLRGSRPVLSFHKARRGGGETSLRRAITFGPWALLPGLRPSLAAAAAAAGTGTPQTFDEQPHLQLLKEIFTQVFATPKRHHKSKPFFDHVLSFSVADGRIWFRNYQARVVPGCCSA